MVRRRNSHAHHTATDYAKRWRKDGHAENVSSHTAYQLTDGVVGTRGDTKTLLSLAHVAVRYAYGIRFLSMRDGEN